jgi:hypothetical protein
LVKVTYRADFEPNYRFLDELARLGSLEHLLIMDPTWTIDRHPDFKSWNRVKDLRLCVISPTDLSTIQILSKGHNWFPHLQNLKLQKLSGNYVTPFSITPNTLHTLVLSNCRYIDPEPITELFGSQQESLRRLCLVSVSWLGHTTFPFHNLARLLPNLEEICVRHAGELSDDVYIFLPATATFVSFALYSPVDPEKCLTFIRRCAVEGSRLKTFRLMIMTRGEEYDDLQVDEGLTEEDLWPSAEAWQDVEKVAAQQDIAFSCACVQGYWYSGMWVLGKRDHGDYDKKPEWALVTEAKW